MYMEAYCSRVRMHTDVNKLHNHSNSVPKIHIVCTLPAVAIVATVVG